MALSTTQYGYIIDPMVPFTDGKGKTIKDGYVRVFVAGSSTPVITYRNFDGAANQDLIELDNSGRTKTSVIGSKGLTYKVCVYDAFHSQESPILTVDKISVIGANITAGAGSTLVTGLDGLTTKPDGFVDASVVGTDGYVAIDHTIVTDDLDTDAKVTAVEDDRYIPLLNEDVNDPDSKMTLGRLWQWVLGKIKSLPTTITSFRTGDVIPVDGPSGTAKMSKDDLLKEAGSQKIANLQKNNRFVDPGSSMPGSLTFEGNVASTATNNRYFCFRVEKGKTYSVTTRLGWNFTAICGGNSSGLTSGLHFYVRDTVDYESIKTYTIKAEYDYIYAAFRPTIGVSDTSEDGKFFACEEIAFLDEVTKTYPKMFVDNIKLGFYHFDQQLFPSSSFSCVILSVSGGEVFNIFDEGLLLNGDKFFYTTDGSTWAVKYITNKVIEVPANSIQIRINYQNGDSLDTYKNGALFGYDSFVTTDYMKGYLSGLGYGDRISQNEIILSSNDVILDRGNARFYNPITLYPESDFTDKSVLIDNGTVLSGNFDFKTTDYITSDTDGRFIECAFGSQANRYFADLCLYDENKTFVRSYKIFGYKAVNIPKNMYIRVCVDRESKVFIGWSGRTTHNVQFGRPTVIWVGTSIPQNMLYPEEGCWQNGMFCRNNAIGSSTLGFNENYVAPDTLTDENISDSEGKYLTATIEELETCYANTQLSDTVKQRIYGYSWESLIKPYIDGTQDKSEIVVIDHGRNDTYRVARTYDQIHNNTIDWSSTDRLTFHGALNYLVAKIHEINPFVEIIISGHFHNSSIDDAYKICEVQEACARHYGFRLFDTWNVSGISDIYVPGTSDYLTNLNTKYGTSFTPMSTDADGNITYFNLYCPDKIHPHSDPTWHSDRLFNTIFSHFLAQLGKRNGKAWKD